ncbi:MAG: FG-GAP-like repeat-containing protein [Ferruginibacter sp.]
MINSFAPVTGPLGTLVTINGNNFSAIPQNNIVYFGAVRARVVSSGISQLTVNVPPGATYEPISVTTNNLTAYSVNIFNVTFPNGGNQFIASSFAERFDSSVATRPTGIVFADFNNDGKPDMAVPHQNPNSIVTVFKNNGRNGKISFAPRMTLPVSTLTDYLATGDINGDGMLDLVSISHINSCGGNCTVSVFINISNDSNIVFSTAIELPTVQTASYITIRDIDGDGKPDLVMISDSPVFTVLRNTSSVNTISFAPKIDFHKLPSAFGINVMAVNDLDGDTRPDIAITNDNDSIVSTFRNTSSPGTISFASRVDFRSGYRAQTMAIADLDQDGKMDIVTVNAVPITGSSSFLKNTSSIGNISFANKMDFSTNAFPFTIAISDLNGDGIPDLAMENFPDDVRLFMNKTPAGGIVSFSNFVRYPVGSTPWGVYVCDLNEDGKPDLIASNAGSASITVLRNTSGEIIVSGLCPSSANTAFYSNVNAVNYQWQVSKDSVSFYNIADGISYMGTNTSKLQLNNVPSYWYGYQYRCLADSTYTNTFTLQFTNTWTGAVNTAWENIANWSCGKLPDAYTDVNIPTGKTIIANSKVVCRTFTVQPGGHVTVTSGNSITILH